MIITQRIQCVFMFEVLYCSFVERVLLCIPTYFLPFFQMTKRAFTSSISLALSLGFVAPAFAYFPRSDFTRPSHREQVEAIKMTKDIRRPSRRSIQSTVDKRSVPMEQRTRTRANSTVTATKSTHLERTRRAWNLRNQNRKPKPGSDRYRVLRPNTRFFRRQVEEQSALPPRIVQTGLYRYDKPTRRDIRENGYFPGIVNRKRDVLGEMKANTR